MCRTPLFRWYFQRSLYYRGCQYHCSKAMANYLGKNTDGKGFLTSLQENDITVLGQEIMILGAGGAARAIAVELALAGAKKITIVNRSRQRGEELTT